MKWLTHIPLWILAAAAQASVYTVAAPHLTMHVGDPVPPLIFNISPYPASYAGTFRGEPARSTSATSQSPPGNYPIHIAIGSLKTVNPEDRVQFADGTLTVIPANPIGARLLDTVAYPPGFLNGPSGYAAVDVTRNATANLVGDCKTDNAAAFALLLSQGNRRTPDTANGGTAPLFLYFPPGCYATSRPLAIYGNTWTLWGSGPQRSYIRLLPNSPAFQTGKPVEFFDPHSVTKNSNFREYIYNLGFNIGVGNPDAIPFTTVQNNSGAVRNVQIWADDAQCPTAISFDREYPGPMLFKDVAVYGCKKAYSASQNEYSITFENFTTEAQTEVALDNRLITASIRHWLSDNSVQALHVYGPITANVALLDSEIRNGAAGTAGIAVDRGAALYVQNLAAQGYSPTEIDAGDGLRVQRTGNIAQAWTGPGRTIFDGARKPDSLHLPVEETPDPHDPDPRQWTRLSANAEDWPAQIQRSASATVYAPPGLYPPTGIVRIDVPDSVNHLQFYQSKFPNGAPQIVLTVAGSSQQPLVVDSCLYSSCQIVHTGSRSIVLRDTTLNSYEARNGAGAVFIEDSMLGYGTSGGPTIAFYPSQHVWARQLNLEQKSSDKLHCDGCTLWVLGYKTEQPSPALVLSHHARAEIFGFFFYMNRAPIAPDTASVLLADSSLFASGWTKVDSPGRGRPNWVIEERKSASSALAAHDIDTSQQMPMFYSFGAEQTNGAESVRARETPAKN